MKLLLLILAVITVTLGYGQNKKYKPIHPTTKAARSPVNIIGIPIKKPKGEAFAFASNPENFPKWLASVQSIQKISGNSWKAETTLGTVTIEFFPDSSLGVIDHNMTLPDKTVVHHSLRVIENGTGSKVVFVLFEMPGKTEADYKKDADAARADLNKLKVVMETGS